MRADFFCILLVMGDDTVEGTVQVDTTIIYRSVFCQHFLTDLWNDRLQLAFQKWATA